MAKTRTRSVELEPIDRLEEKMKLLVGMVERMKREQARAAEENQRLSRELDALRARVSAERRRRRRADDAPRRARRDPRRASPTCSSSSKRSTCEHRVRPVAVSRRPCVTRRAHRSGRDSRDSAIRSAARSIRRTSRGWRPTSTRRCAPRPRPTPSGDSLRLAVLAALNIADELFRCREATRAPATAQCRRARARRSNGWSIAVLHDAGAIESPDADACKMPADSTATRERLTVPAAQATILSWLSALRVMAVGSFEPTFYPSESRRRVVCMPLCEEA